MMKGFSLTLFLSLILCAPAFAQYKSSRAVEYVDGEIIVKFKNTATTMSNKQAVITSLGGGSFKKIKNLDYVTIKLSSSDDVQDAVSRYSSSPDIEIAQPNYIYRVSTIPNDTYYPYLWGLKNTGQTIPLSLEGATSVANPGTSGADINMEPVWSKITDCHSVVVAILDTGVNYNHGDLNANMWDGGATYPHHGYDFVNTDNDPMDDNGHGTHLAGVIGAVGNNNQGGTGVCWTASIMAIKAIRYDGSGTTLNVIQGIDFAIKNGARIINMSFGSTGNDPTLASEITAAEQAGVLVVAAAGNDGEDMDATTKTYPCAYANSNVICVAALDQMYNLTSFSNYGTTSVDVGAPGMNIYSSWFADVIASDDFTSCWTIPAGGTGSAWGCPKNLNIPDILAIPTPGYGSSNYANNTNSEAYKNYTIDNTCSSVFLSFDAAIDVEPTNDSFKIYYNNVSGNPIGGTLLATISQAGNPPYSLDGYQYPIPNCDLSATCSIGVQLVSNGSVTATGVGITNFHLYGVRTPTTTYMIEHGTSMATPYVTGLAAILMEYNPSYIYSDVKNAILNGGKSISALSQKTTSGKAIDGWGSLTYINAPTDVTGTVNSR